MGSNEVTVFRRQAMRQGWSVRRTGSGHWKFTSPQGMVVISSATPGDRRAMANLRAYLRRAGLTFDT